MLSNLSELVGMAAVVYGVYVIAGQGVAALIGGALLIVVGFAIDGVTLPALPRLHLRRRAGNP